MFFFRNSLPHAIFNDGIVSVCLCVSSSVMSNSLQPHGLWLTSLFCAWNSPGKNTTVRFHSLLQEIFPTQESNLGLLHWQVDSLLSESSIVKAMVFPVVMDGCESCWTIKKVEHQRIDAFELWHWRRLLRAPGTQGNKSSQS